MKKSNVLFIFADASRLELNCYGCKPDPISWSEAQMHIAGYQSPVAQLLTEYRGQCLRLKPSKRR